MSAPGALMYAQAESEVAESGCTFCNGIQMDRNISSGSAGSQRIDSGVFAGSTSSSGSSGSQGAELTYFGPMPDDRTLLESVKRWRQT